MEAISCVWSQCISHESPVTSFTLWCGARKWISKLKNRQTKITISAKKMIWMKELEDKGLGTNLSALRSIISAVLQWISTCSNRHCISQQNFQFSAPHVTLSFFMSSFNLLLFYLLWAKLPHGQIVTQQSVFGKDTYCENTRHSLEQMKEIFWPHSLQQSQVRPSVYTSVFAV